MTIIDEIRNDLQGAELLSDWLGAGGMPVAHEVAEHRASVCSAGNLGQPCPNNVEPNWWDRFKNAVAETIRKELSIKRRLNYATSRDSSLHMCKVCGCCLPLKVQVPIKHVREHTTDAHKTAFPPYCWIKRELDPL